MKKEHEVKWTTVTYDALTNATTSEVVENNFGVLHFGLFSMFFDQLEDDSDFDFDFFGRQTMTTTTTTNIWASTRAGLHC